MKNIDVRSCAQFTNKVCSSLNLLKRSPWRSIKLLWARSCHRCLNTPTPARSSEPLRPRAVWGIMNGDISLIDFWSPQHDFGSQQHELGNKSKHHHCPYNRDAQEARRLHIRCCHLGQRTPCRHSTWGATQAQWLASTNPQSKTRSRTKRRTRRNTRTTPWLTSC